MSFAFDVSRWVKKTGVNLDLVVRKISLDMFARVILRTPVDTGRARGNWQVSIGAVNDSVIEVNDKAGTVTISKAAAAVAKVKAGDTIFLCNSLPYIHRLETGWSKQAPAGMVGITIEEFMAVVEKTAQETK